jgi:hypothetical protein
MMSRKTHDNTGRDEFAREAGIDLGNEHIGGVFDELHKIEADRLKQEIKDNERLFLEYAGKLYKANRRCDKWLLAALLGWGMFAIACLSRL